MKLDVLDQTGKKIDEVVLHPEIFEAPINASLVAQAIRVRMINARSGTAQAQTRAEVRGGGRKPWKQKGTGRARHGSTRSPIWKGGGVSHGPRAHKPSADMPQSMRRAALFSALTDKVNQKQVVVVDGLSLEHPKTKLMAQIINSLPLGKTVLVVMSAKDEQLERAGRNLSQLKMMTARVLHPYEILQYHTIVFLRGSLTTLEETFLKKPTILVESVDGELTKRVPKKITTSGKKTVLKDDQTKVGVK